jgi:uncharacterized protein (UPF0305 family)
MAHASLERQLVAAQAAKAEAERKLREQEVVVERLERDRRWLAEREEQERLEKEKERIEYDEEKVCLVLNIAKITISYVIYIAQSGPRTTHPPKHHSCSA